MKKLSLLLTFAFALFLANAQDKAFKNVNTNFLLGKFEEAKTELDKAMADPKNESKAEAWLWKTRIWAELYGDEKLEAKYPDAGKTALEAFKKYESMDKDLKMIADASVSWRSADLIYVNSFNRGRKQFDAKKWAEAFDFFTKAEYIGEVFTKKNLRNNGAVVDTFIVLYTAYAAQNAKKSDDAAFYYGKLADKKIGGNDYKDIYSYLLVYNSDKKQKDNFFKYLGIAKELYPTEDWDDYEFDYFTKNYSMQEKVDAYSKEDAAGTLSARKYMLYGQLFSEISRDEKSLDSASKASYQHKSTDAFLKAFNKDNKLAIAAFNAGVNYYNDFNIYDERMYNNRKLMQEINSTKVTEKDPKKKAAAEAAIKAKADAVKKLNTDIEKPLNENLDNAISWLEKSFLIFKDMPTKDRTVKNCLNNAVKWLANCYQYKRDRAKGKDLKAYDAFDAKYKEYDALYDKF